MYSFSMFGCKSGASLHVLRSILGASLPPAGHIRTALFHSEFHLALMWTSVSARVSSAVSLETLMYKSLAD